MGSTGEGIEMMTTLLELADRCEKAEGPDHELDKAIAEALNIARYYLPASVAWHITGSLDAAMNLAEGCILVNLSDISADGLPTAVLYSSISPPVEHIGICRDGRNATRKGKLTLALCAAALRARASVLKTTGNYCDLD